MHTTPAIDSLQTSPEAVLTDQGSQFTSLAFTDVLTDAGIHISMDGKGRWMDNVFIERLWRSLKYEQVYLAEYATAQRPGLASAGGSMSTTSGGRTRRSWTGRPTRRILCGLLWDRRRCPITARGGLTYEPGLHLNLVAELSEGWGPLLTEGGGRQSTRWPGPCEISHW